jgi:CheY-like chemotaxis protein
MKTPLRVLLVEDSEDDMWLILRELRRGGYEPIHERVETAEALGAALGQQPWDAVIADLRTSALRRLGGTTAGAGERAGGALHPRVRHGR